MARARTGTTIGWKSEKGRDAIKSFRRWRPGVYYDNRFQHVGTKTTENDVQTHPLGYWTSGVDRTGTSHERRRDISREPVGVGGTNAGRARNDEQKKNEVRVRADIMIDRVARAGVLVITTVSSVRHTFSGWRAIWG